MWTYWDPISKQKQKQKQKHPDSVVLFRHDSCILTSSSGNLRQVSHRSGKEREQERACESEREREREREGGRERTKKAKREIKEKP